jgi:hypothetical protein
MDWVSRICRVLRHRRATVAQLTERLAGTRLWGFGDQPLDPAFLAAIEQLRATGQIRWAPLNGRQRARRLEVAR